MFGASSTSRARLATTRVVALLTGSSGGLLYAAVRVDGQQPPSTQCQALPKSNLQTRMTSIGRFSLLSETLHNPSIIAFFMILQGGRMPMSPADLTTIWQRQDMARKHPRFHQALHPRRLSMFQDNSVNDRSLGDCHVSETTYPHNRHDILSRMSVLQQTPWDLTQKIWSLQIANAVTPPVAQTTVRGSSCPTPQQLGHRMPAAATTMLLFQGHHVLGDGASLGAAIMDLCDEDLSAPVRAALLAQRQKKKRATLWHRLGRTLYQLLAFCIGSMLVVWHVLSLWLWSSWHPVPWSVLQHEYETTVPPPLHSLLLVEQQDDDDARRRRRRLSYTTVAPLDQVKWIARTLGDEHDKITVNDVLCSCVSAAMGRLWQYHRRRRQIMAVAPEKSDWPIQEHMVLALPVHLTGGVLMPGESLGNKLGALAVTVPCEAPALLAQDRLQQTHQALQAVKRTPLAWWSHVLARAISTVLAPIVPQHWLGAWYARAHAGASVVVTNTRGPPQPVHINGRVVTDLYGFIPLPPGVPVGVVVSSYAGTCKLTVTAEPWAVPDSDQFATWILQEYLALVEVAKMKSKQQAGGYDNQACHVT